MGKLEWKKPSGEQLEKRANRSTSSFEGFIKDKYKIWKKVKEGNYIRILPNYDDNTHWGLQVFVHYEVGPRKASVLCLTKMKNQPCPICEERAKLEKRGASKDDLQAYRYAAPFLVWLLDRRNAEEEQKGAQLWPMPGTVERDIISVSRDRRTGEWVFVESPDEGYEIEFDVQGEKKLTKYVGLKLARKPTSVQEEYLQYVADNPLRDVLLWRSYDEVLALMNGDDAPDDARETRSAQREDNYRPREDNYRPREDQSEKSSTRRDDHEPSWNGPSSSSRAIGEDEIPFNQDSANKVTREPNREKIEDRVETENRNEIEKVLSKDETPKETPKTTSRAESLRAALAAKKAG